MNRREKRKQAEFIKFLRWLEDGPKPWLVPHIRKWKNQHENWQLKREQTGRPWSIGYLNPTIDKQAAKLYALKRAFYFVKRSGYIDIRKRGDELIIALSDRGRNRLFQETAKQAPALDNNLVLLVLFDIPIDANHARQAFRYFLREHGFRRLQHSVWYTNYDLQKILTEFVHELKLEKWVHVALADFRTILPK